MEAKSISERQSSTSPSERERVAAAFAAVNRARFLPPGTPPALAAADETVPLGPPGINNGQPSLHAQCLRALAPQPGERALHIGAGSGYYTAILAHLCSEVVAFELDPGLAAWARRNLADLPGVLVEARSGALPPLPDADVIYVNCGATGPLPLWLDALRPGGRLLFPLTGRDGTGRMLWIRRPATESNPWPARLLMPVAFISCQGARRRDEALAVAAALARGPAAAAAVAFFHRGMTPPGRAPVNAWCVGHGWWLSE